MKNGVSGVLGSSLSIGSFGRDSTSLARGLMGNSGLEMNFLGPFLGVFGVLGKVDTFGPFLDFFFHFWCFSCFFVIFCDF